MSHHTDCTGYEFAAGSINGLRSFNVDNLGRLRGVSHPAIWRPEENVAYCPDARELDPDAPETESGEPWYRHAPGRCEDDSHGCGFWAYHDGSRYDAGDVDGVIEGYGKTTVGTKGFRCEKARVVALCLPAEPLARPKIRRGLLAFWTGLLALNTWGVWFKFDTDPWYGTAISGFAVAIALLWMLLVVRPVHRGCRHPIRHRWDDACTCAAGFGIRRLNAEAAAKVRRNYPGVKFYDSLAEMKAAHPVDPAVEPSPENDPTFWDDTTNGTPEMRMSGGLVHFTPPQLDMANFQQTLDRVNRMVARRSKNRYLP